MINGRKATTSRLLAFPTAMHRQCSNSLAKALGNGNPTEEIAASVSGSTVAGGRMDSRCDGSSSSDRRRY
jgi:hypothetical protein